MVLDSSAIVAIFKKEPGYEILERKIDDAPVILVGAPTMVETAIVLARMTGRDQRALLEAYLRRIDARVVEFTESHYSLAAEAFSRFGRGFNSKANLNYGDCLSYAVAASAGDSLLFVGDDFQSTDITPA
jgi:ribonuclease VapC